MRERKQQQPLVDETDYLAHKGGERGQYREIDLRM